MGRIGFDEEIIIVFTLEILPVTRPKDKAQEALATTGLTREVARQSGINLERIATENLGAVFGG